MDTMNLPTLWNEIPPLPPPNESSLANSAATRTHMPTMATLAAELRGDSFKGVKLCPGARIGRYEIIERLGVGGFGSVYAAQHIYIKHRVALKTIKPGMETNEVGERFLREARVIAALGGRGVVQVYDVDMWEGHPYIALELIKGRNVAEALKISDRFSINRVLDLLEEMAHVLVRQQLMNIVHRDIKPSNICIRANGQFCLLDYGIVGVSSDKTLSVEEREQIDFRDVTQEGSIIGTPTYMSPEQSDGSGTFHQSDLFSLGLTAWECLCGRPARGFNARESFSDSMSNIRRPIQNAREIRNDIPKALDNILQGLVEIDRAKRYSSAKHLLQDIEDFRYHGRTPPGPIEGAVFVAIPFSQKFAGVFESIATGSSELRLQANRMDRLVFVQDIWRQMVDEIERSAIIVADFSCESWRRRVNPNVVTEAAHARALGKPLILISQDAPEKLPFDWRHMPVIRYANNTRGLEELKRKIAERLRELRKRVQ